MKNKKRTPDFSRLKKVLKNEGEPDRVPFYELFADKPIIEAILNRPVNDIKDYIDYQYKMGYDYLTLSGSRHFKNFSFPTARKEIESSLSKRLYNTGDMGVINNWKDFEYYPWPNKKNIDFSIIEKTERLLPKGMKIIVRFGHNLEYTTELMGFTGLSYALIDQIDLVDAIFEKIGDIMLYAYKVCVQNDIVGAVEIADDLGFKTNTLVSPEILKKNVFPWYKRYVEISHQYDVPVILHSCGQIRSVMDDIIDCGIDAKHSFEEQIINVIDFKKEYGKQLAVLGGMDIDFLSRASENEVRIKTRKVLEECMPGGGYALGTGNSVTDYIPVKNFLAMIDEGWEMGIY